MTKGRPYWFPKLVDNAYLQQLRDDYPEQAHLDDDSLKEHFDLWWKYADTWDHLGDARDEYEKLADAYLALIAKYPEEAPNE